MTPSRRIDRLCQVMLIAMVAPLRGDQPMIHKEALASLPKATSREALERLVVQLAGVAQRCTDAACRRDLMRLANELVYLVEEAEEPEKAQQTH
jgi:hypothetical protein